MDIKKLKIEKIKNINIVNFPDKYKLPSNSTDLNIEVIIYYIDSVNDVSKFVKYCDSIELPDENRTIMVYEKGRKDGVNRDSIIGPFKSGKYPNYKLKAPMLCSISETLSACVFTKTK